MTQRARDIADPWRWTIALTVLFIALAAVRLTVPGTPIFDEIHYLPAARAFLENGVWVNREHPMLGKTLLAASIAIFGDTAFGWRILPLLAGALTVYAGMRALWFTTGTRFASLAYGFLLGTGFHLFVHARIAMLDIFMVAFFMVALWQCAAAVRQPETGRWRLAVAGIAIGLAMGSKWNVVLVAMLPGLAFFVARVLAGRERPITSRPGAPVPGVALWEAALLLGLIPLCVYWLTFVPALFAPDDPMALDGFLALHRDILSQQASVIKPHPYQSQWPDWVLNQRAIWYLYENIEGAQRGIMLIGNPLTMLAGLPALLWAAWAGIARRRWDALAVAVLYVVSMATWVVADKPIQFYYHYFLPSCFLLAALALALDAAWQRARQAETKPIWLSAYGFAPLLILAGAGAFFAYFYPIMNAWPLASERSFMTWAWFTGWR